MQQIHRSVALKFFNFYVGEKGRPKNFGRFLSYLHRGGKNSYSYKTVGQLLDESAEKYGDRIAYVSSYQNQRISFLDVKKKADELAAGILALGIDRGDRVGLWAPNSLEWYITSFALAKAGVISVYLNPSYQALEIEQCLNAVGVKMLIMGETFKTQNYPEILSRLVPEMAESKPGKIKCKKIPSLESVVCISEKDIPGVIPYQRISESATENSRKKYEELQKIISPDESSNIQFTSGTTGSPKGAVLNHFHIVNNSFFISVRLQVSEKRHTMCLMGPLFHAMGSSIAILTCLHEGITLVVPEKSFSPANAVNAILEEKCTILLGTPTMYVDVVKIMREKGLRSAADIALCGGAFAPPQLINNIYQYLGVKRFSSVYGLTESGPVCFMSLATDSKDKASSTVGYIMDHVEAKVVDGNGRTVPWDAPGELWVRGYNIMRGYWGEETKTKETITPEKWLRTGDQFGISSDGYGKIMGRIKEMIIRGGENIFPAEIEDFLSKHPDILDIQVVGVPDKRLGEQLCACIRLKPNSKLTADELKNYCRGKIADFKIPHYVYFVEDFPRTSSEKVQKFKLRQQAIEYLKLEKET